MRRLLFAFVWFCLVTNSAFAISPQQRSILFTHKLWTPLNLGSALVAWWNAHNISSLSLSGSNVLSWTDIVGGIVASQATGANQPTWSATARNGKAGVSFAGGTRVLNFGTNAVLPTGAATSFLALAGYANAVGGAYLGTFGYGSASSTNGRGFQKTNTNVVDVDVYGTGNLGPAWSATDLFVEGLFSGGAISGFANGTSFGTSTTVAFNTTASSGTIGQFVGANPFQGIVQQIFVLNVVPTTSQRQKLEGWESWYDGKSGTNLPSSNPYGSTGTLRRPPYVSDP